MFCFQKVSCSFNIISAFLLLPQFHFQWVKLTLSFYETKKLEKLVYELLKKGVWRKIFPRLKNKAFCKRLKRWVEFLLFAQIYAVLNQNNWWAVNHWRQLHVLISSSQINQASFKDWHVGLISKKQTVRNTNTNLAQISSSGHNWIVLYFV